MKKETGAHPERLLTVAEVAELLGTSERFPRRLIAERRIEFVKIGRHVRIRESVLAAFISAGSVGPLGHSDNWHNGRGAA
jgi:excisionase family DNA binding protein